MARDRHIAQVGPDSTAGFQDFTGNLVWCNPENCPTVSDPRRLPWAAWSQIPCGLQASSWLEELHPQVVPKSPGAGQWLFLTTTVNSWYLNDCPHPQFSLTLLQGRKNREVGGNIPPQCVQWNVLLQQVCLWGNMLALLLTAGLYGSSLIQ